jgi:hypothetical protein
MQIEEFALLIERTAVSRFMATTPLIYPLVSAVHLFGISLVLGSILYVDLRLLKVLGPHFDPALTTMVRISLLGFTVACTTGILMASVRLADYISNPAFLAKLLILLAAGLNAVLLRLISGFGDLQEVVGQKAGRISAIASLCLWIMALLAGRWIAFA